MADAESNDTGNRPVVELFVKAASDKIKNGSCPICHQYFLAFYLLRERGMIDLVVTTFLPESPPREVLEFSNGKHYPLLKIHKGVDANGKDMTGEECDTLDEIEAILDRFECQEMLNRQVSNEESKAEKIFEDIYKVFNHFLKDPKDDSTRIVKNLENLNAYLGDNGTRFMVSDSMRRADCYLLPRLQHIRVAGYAYKGFNLPPLKYLWKYLEDAYSTDAFQESCPEDEEIVNHYRNKCSVQPNIKHVRELRKKVRSLDIPELVEGANGVNGE